MASFRELYNLIQFNENYEYINDDKDSGYKALSLFNRCVNCNCCERHQVNKPNSWTPIPIHQFRRSTNFRNGYYCNCSCRHLARDLCRNHPNSIYLIHYYY